MINSIPAPQKGQPLRAAWASQVTAAVNGIRAAGMRGVLVRDGAGAFGAEPLPENMRARRGAATATSIPGCWQMTTASREVVEDGETVTQAYTTLANRYYAAGELTVHLPEEGEANALAIDIADYTSLLDDENGSVYLCLKVSAVPGSNVAPAIVGYTSFADMALAQKDDSFVIRPLYLLNAGGAVICDFRATLPKLQMTEVLA